MLGFIKWRQPWAIIGIVLDLVIGAVDHGNQGNTQVDAESIQVDVSEEGHDTQDQAT